MVTFSLYKIVIIVGIPLKTYGFFIKFYISPFGNFNYFRIIASHSFLLLHFLYIIFRCLLLLFIPPSNIYVKSIFKYLLNKRLNLFFFVNAIGNLTKKHDLLEIWSEVQTFLHFSHQINVLLMLTTSCYLSNYFISYHV